jgi:hypothetical protein
MPTSHVSRLTATLLVAVALAGCDIVDMGGVPQGGRRWVVTVENTSPRPGARPSQCRGRDARAGSAVRSRQQRASSAPALMATAIGPPGLPCPPGTGHIARVRQ